MNESNMRELLKLYEEGKATEEQRRLVEAYLAYHQQQGPKREQDNNPDSLQEIMNKISLARQEQEEEAPVYSIYEDAEEDHGKRRRIGWMAAASVIVVVVTAGLLWKQSGHKPTPEPIATTYKTIKAAPGRMIHLLLSDSSEVWLKAGAVLRYPQPLDDKMRKLELLDGEAFFQVHPDATRGFIVKTDRLQTTVLGTSFNIKAYRQSQQMSVTVATGKVEVSPGTTGKSMFLTADQQARYNTGTGQLSRNTIAAVKMPDWKVGDFDFTEESLGDIAIELEHYFNVHIGFKYAGMKKYTISASFRHGTQLEDILTTLCLLNQNHFTQTDAQHYVIH